MKLCAPLLRRRNLLLSLVGLLALTMMLYPDTAHAQVPHCVDGGAIRLLNTNRSFVERLSTGGFIMRPLFDCRPNWIRWKVHEIDRHNHVKHTEGIQRSKAEFENAARGDLSHDSKKTTKYRQYEQSFLPENGGPGSEILGWVMEVDFNNFKDSGFGKLDDESKEPLHRDFPYALLLAVKATDSQNSTEVEFDNINVPPYEATGWWGMLLQYLRPGYWIDMITVKLSTWVSSTIMAGMCWMIQAGAPVDELVELRQPRQTTSTGVSLTFRKRLAVPCCAAFRADTEEMQKRAAWECKRYYSDDAYEHIFFNDITHEPENAAGDPIILVPEVDLP